MAFDLLSFLLGKSIGSGGGGGSAALGPKTIRQNGIYRAASDNLDGYNTVTVEVPNTYAAADEGKVVSNGALTAQTSRTVTENGTYDTTLNDEVVVNVPSGGGGDEDLINLINGTLTDLECAATRISSFVFRSHPSIERLLFPQLTTISTACCYQARKLITFYAPNLTGTIPDESFNSCSLLSNVNIGNATRASTNCFYNCSSLTDFSPFKKLTGYGQNAFYGTRFPVIVAPLYTTGTPNNAFANNSALTACDIPTSSLAANLFNNCSALNIVILRRDASICTLSNISAFNNTPFASNGTGGTLYVPSALIASYEAATNWSTILGYTNNKILPIEGSIYENAYADGTPIVA